ncbi:hypothetical protein MMC14_004629 [Varicellaria rhodocarpa]|nr:hypothetical protein [Varicellaria rhodocarpa]
MVEITSISGDLLRKLIVHAARHISSFDCLLTAFFYQQQRVMVDKFIDQVKAAQIIDVDRSFNGPSEKKQWPT